MPLHDKKFFLEILWLPRRLLKSIILKLQPNYLIDVIFSIVKAKTFSLSAADSLKFLLLLERKLGELTDQEAVRYDNGLHTKHRHTKYHDFFIHNIEPGSRILDIGCGIGIVASDIAQRVSNVSVCGIDIDAANIEQAQRRFPMKNIQFICGDALSDLPGELFDVIVLSNVLEHIEHRVEFLQMLQNKYHARRILIRIPIFERNWRVPLQQELKLDYRLDPTHYIEYRQEEFLREIERAGCSILSSQVKWGEIWAEVASNES